MELKPGYKQTETGGIPEEWNIRSLGDLFSLKHGFAFSSECFSTNGPIVLTPGNFRLEGGLYFDDRNTKRYSGNYNSKMIFRKDDLLIVMTDLTPDCNLLGKPAFVHLEETILHNQRIGKVVPKSQDIDKAFLFFVLLSPQYLTRIREMATGSTVRHTSNKSIYSILILVPPLCEQRAIAEALSDVDALIGVLDQLIAKKRDLKQAAMQQLLTGHTRLPGFTGKWKIKTLQETTDCLDNLRVPLNESQREKMRGDYPYCGANGILDYVNGYVIDDDIILMAEDGGYFDEYAYRPIAYRMVGKCWVNNHAHILKAKQDYDQGFIFYSLVHKNILNFLASGTRAKLNKSEMEKIEVLVPMQKNEQTAIAQVLSDMDAEIEALEARREKTTLLKQGMMQELLTGKTRLV
ncbi:MAG: restriction endonuclease subunit S [Nitrospira sp.]|nr:restriction endonuclease subunit S [Nitrospira sp.]